MHSIWKLLDDKEKKLFIFLFIFNIFVILFELISLSSIFPIIYSLNNDLTLLENFRFSKEIFKFLKDYNYNPVIFFLIFLIIVLIIKNIFLAIYSFFESKFIFETQENISSKLFNTLINKKYSFHIENSSADLITRVRTDGVLIRDVINSFHRLLKSLIFLLSIFFFLLYIDPIGFILAFTTFTILGSLFYYYSAKKNSQLGKLRQKFEIERTKKLQESFRGIKDIKTFQKTNMFVNYYYKLAFDIAKVYYLRDFIAKLPKVFLEILIVIVVVILTLTLMSNSRQESEIIAILSVFGITSIKAIPHMSSLLSSMNTLKFSKQAIDFYNTNLDLENNFQKKNHSEGKILSLKSFEFSNINFKYTEKKNYLFKNLNVGFSVGEVVKIEGPTGTGKSSLIDIILGLQTPESFKFKINNQEQELPKDWLNYFSYVPQTIFLFDTSIKNNITMDEKNEKFDEKLFLKSLKIAKVDEFIDKLSKREDTLIGELGSHLSGGQKQRIGIARAIYKNSPVMILDEATNALDLKIEKTIYKNLFENFSEKLFLIVNHREMEEKFFSKIIKL